MTQFRLITLDLDETLWPISPTLERAEQRLFEWLQTNAPKIAYSHTPESLHQKRLAIRSLQKHLAHDVTAVRHALLSELCAEFGYPAHCADEAMTVFLEARNDVYPYADSIAFLQRAARCYPLAALTNGNADIKKTALAEYIGYAVSAASAGASKPDPAIFLQALDWAGVRPGEALHIGDDPELDVAGARSVGMATAWINRSGRTWPTALPSPDLIIDTLNSAELHCWLGI